MSITLIIVGFTVLVSMYAFQKPAVLKRLILNPYVVTHRKEYYRFLTSGFIHKDHMHLIFNMLSMYFFGGVVEKQFNYIFASRGDLYFILLYVLGIIISDVPSFLKHKDNPGYNSLGASGGVASVIFAFILLRPLDKICLYFALCFEGFILGALYLVFSYYQGRKANDNVNHDAHLFGALFGLLFIAVLHPQAIPEFFEQVSHWSWFKD
ncbi:rhomboid family intramembrane serine protease [Chryseolinea sp. T2]|uniref:rhomboid family intramembrane serine protease n=1 Tax=Chryseolinea sp. T2 TaxID=3129255 RepID=UPI0030776302